MTEKELFEEYYKTSRDYKFYIKHEMTEKQIFEFKNNKYTVDCVNDGWLIWQAAKASATTAWVSVDDRLPDFKQEVLLISGSERLIGQYLPSAVNEFGIHFDEGFWINEGATIVNATHWQLLPKLSKAQEQSQ